MGIRNQCLVHPYGSAASTDQDMANRLKKTFQGFDCAEKGATPSFHPRIEIRKANPHFIESEPQRELKGPNLNKGAGSEMSFLKVLKALGPTYSLYFPACFPLPPNFTDS